jgi:leader peptidase (prepilin peptidase)/N-methyltransferase
MNTVLFIFIFVFGTIIGSFLNVVIIRYGTGRSLGGRSMCAVTGKTLEWYELIPIVSFLIQGGRSRHSGTRISWQYPLVELFTGVVFVLLASKFILLAITYPKVFLINLLFYFFVFSYLVMIFVYDMRHRIIPNGFLYPLAIIAFCGVFLLPVALGIRPTMSTLWGFLSGPIVALPLLALWAITKKKGMGLGDVKLVIPLGWLVGLSGGFAMLLMSFWIGAIIAVVLLVFGGKHMKSEIPFGPFIIVGFAIVFLSGIGMPDISQFFDRLI